MPPGDVRTTIEKMPASPKSPLHGIVAICSVAHACLLLSCASLETNPAWNPEASAPPSPEATWTPPKGKPAPQSLDELLSLPPVPSEQTPASDLPSKANAARTLQRLGEGVPASSEEEPLELAELVDIALSKNPSTRESWQRARAAAAELGESMGDYYPEVRFEAAGGAQKFLMEFPQGTAV